MTAATRNEHDLLGDREVPADAYWGIHTLRALENFPITGQAIGSYRDLVRALALVKHAAAITNRSLGALDAERADAIVAACAEIADGALDGAFVVDVIQGGAGTSTNMNANEVIANRALEILGHRKGEYQHLHPNNHVNMSQSTNDVYPTAIRVGVCFAIAAPARRDGRAATELRGEGDGVRRRAQDGPHPAPGRGADDARPGIQHFRGDDRGGRGAAARGRGCSCTRSTSAPRRSAPASTPTRATPGW